MTVRKLASTATAGQQFPNAPPMGGRKPTYLTMNLAETGTNELERLSGTAALGGAMECRVEGQTNGESCGIADCDVREDFVATWTLKRVEPENSWTFLMDSCFVDSFPVGSVPSPFVSPRAVLRVVCDFF